MKFYMNELLFYLDQFNLNTYTLFLTALLPFSYFVYSKENFYDEKKIKAYNFINIFISALIICFAFYKIGSGALEGSYENIDTNALHIAICFLSILIIFKNKSSNVDTLIDSFLSSKGLLEDTNQSKDAPKAVNKELIGEYTWEDLIINDDLKDELNSIINLLKDPENAKQYGIDIPKGILFFGPPGTGKTTIARVVANLAGVNFFVLRMNEIVSKWVGESEKNLTKLFEAASQNAPSIIFIDEIDSIGKARSSANADHADKLLNQLLQLIDGVIKTEGIYVIAATNRPDLVDSALKRAGRLNRAIEIGLPNEEARILLFELYTKNLKFETKLDLEMLAKKTENCSAADIKAICNQAGLYSYRREEFIPKKDRTYLISDDDLNRALEDFTKDKEEIKDFSDSNKKKDEFVPQNEAVEKIGWDDIIISQKLKEELISVVKLLKGADNARKYGIEVPKGMLLYGPPGTGKTTIAKVMANTANMAFFVLETSDIVSKWVGDSEKNLTALFKSAEKYAPSILFIDEIDSIARNRNESNAQHADNLLNHLLQLIDGVIKKEGIYIIGATNREDLVDPALKRGGRLTKSIYIPLPDFDSRVALLKLFLSKYVLDFDVNYEYVAELVDGKSGADIKGICAQAGLNSFKRNVALGIEDYKVSAEDLKEALEELC
ncbi:MAG: AAA family ATPase [Bdellovibrionota bacterium]